MKIKKILSKLIPAATRLKYVVFFFVGIVVLLAVYAYISQNILTPEQKILKETSFTGEQPFSSEGYKDYLAKVDTYLASGEVSKETELILLLRKAMVLLDSQEPVESVREAMRNQGGDILKDIYNRTDSDTATRVAQAEVVAQYLLYFNQLFFMPSNTKFLPEIYSADFIKATEGVGPIDGSSRFVQEAFKAHVALSQDKRASVYANDTTFISNRIYLVASYLDAYYNDMTSKEKAEVISLLEQDIKAYPTTAPILFTDKRHTELTADFYYAYGHDVYVRVVGETEEFSPEKVISLYEHARDNVDITQDFKEANAVMGQYINTYYLNFLLSEKLDAERAEAKPVEELVMYGKDANSARIVSYLYKAFKRRGSDLPHGATLSQYGEKDPVYSSYVQDTLGVR